MVQDGQRKGDIEKTPFKTSTTNICPLQKKVFFSVPNPPCAKDGIMDGRKDVYARLVSRL